MGGAGAARGEDRLVHGGHGGVAARGVSAGTRGRERRRRGALARGAPRVPPRPRPAGPPAAVPLPELARRHTARLHHSISHHHL